MNNSLALAVVMLVIISSICLPLAAASGRKGSTVVVTLTDGRLVKGELLVVKSDALWIYDHDACRGERLEMRQMTRLKLFRKSKALQGLAIGLGVGSAMGVLIPHEHYNNGVVHILLPTYTGFVGAIIGIFACLPKNFSLAGASPLARQLKLERLGRYARESEAERSAAMQ